MRNLVGLGVVICLVGCSFMLTEHPPSRVRKDEFVACSTSRAAPVLDTIVTVLAVVATGAFATAGEADEGAAASGIGAMVFGLSAINGFSATHRCELYRQEVEWLRSSPPPARADARR